MPGEDEENLDQVAELKASLARGEPCYGYTFSLDTDQTVMLGKLEALKGHAPAESITIENMEISDKTAREIAKHLKELPGLERLWLDNIGISDEGLDAILQAIRPAPHLKCLTLHCATKCWGDESSLSNQSLATLCGWLESEECQLSTLETKRELEGPAASRIIASVGLNRSLSCFAAQFTSDFTTQAAQELTQAITPDTNLTMVSIGAYVHRDDPETIIAPTADALEQYAQAMLKSMGKNASSIQPSTPFVEVVTKINNRGITDVVNHFCSADSEHPEPGFDARASMVIRPKRIEETLALYYPQEPGQKPIYEAYRDYQLTPVDLETVTLESLVTPDEKGFAPLDRPGVWAQFDDIIKTLAAKGTPLTPELLETPSPHDGISFVEHGVASFADQMLPFLSRHGYPVADLLFNQKDRSTTTLFDRCTKQGQLPLIFQHHSEIGMAGWQVQAAAAKLPEDEMHYHLPAPQSLSANIARQARAEERSR